MATIVLIEHPQQQRIGVPYMLHAIAQRWSAAGHRVLVHGGTGAPPPGDVAILHVDLTVIPEAYRSVLAQYPTVLNAGVFNIAKSAYSALRLLPGQAWEGPVIVKTDANFGGQIDARLHALAAEAHQAPVLRRYPVFASASAVPPEVWSTPGLLVERFLPERDGEGYALRMWTFFGAAERSSRYLSPSAIAKADRVHSRQDVPVPEEIRAWRARLGFDFGKFDYVYSEGRYWLLDANRTPGAPSEFANNPETAAFLDKLATGLDAYLR